MNNKQKQKKPVQKVVPHTKPTGQTLPKKLQKANTKLHTGKFSPENADGILAESIRLQQKAQKSKIQNDAESVAHQAVKRLGQPAPFDKNEYVSSSTTTFTNTPFFYRRVPVKDADMILMDDTKRAREAPEEMIDFVNSSLLQIKDPVLRETIRQEEYAAIKDEKVKQERIRNYLLSTLTNNEKIKALIKEGATNRTILNAMYNLLPRVMPTRKLRHNVDQLDWLGGVRHRWMNEVEPNGYDVEDSDDPDTLPQQRPFTRDEMHRLLQDVEESKFIESDVDEALFAPTAAIADLRRELQEVEIERQLRFVLKNVSPDALRPEKLDYKMMREEFKQLLGAPPTKRENQTNLNAKTREQKAIDNLSKQMEIPGKLNQLSETLPAAILGAREARREKYGLRYLPGADSGRMDAEDILLPSTITNAGLGLVPPIFDITELPVHRKYDHIDNRIDIYEDADRPFQSRFDIACAVVLNKIMGAQGLDIPTYLTDTVQGDVVLESHPSFAQAKVDLLKDLKNGGQKAVRSIKDLMTQGYHPSDVMKRLVKHLDSILYASDERETFLFDANGAQTDDINKSIIALNSEDLERLGDYVQFVKEAMKTADVHDVAKDFVAKKTRLNAAVEDDAVFEPITTTNDFSAIQRDAISLDAGYQPGQAAGGYDATSYNKATFQSATITDNDGKEVSVTRVTTDTHPEGLIARSSLQAQEPGIGNVHRITPYEIDLSNRLGIETTDPQSSEFGFRPNQKTIYGKQVINPETADMHLIKGLASHEVPATRFTTDGSEITLDPYKSKDYTLLEMNAALDNYEDFVKSMVKNDQILAQETAALFVKGMPGLSALTKHTMRTSPKVQTAHTYNDIDTTESVSEEVDMVDPIIPAKRIHRKFESILPFKGRMGDEYNHRILDDIVTAARASLNMIVKPAEVQTGRGDDDDNDVDVEALTQEAAEEQLKEGKISPNTKVIRVYKSKNGEVKTQYVPLYRAVAKYPENRDLNHTDGEVFTDAENHRSPIDDTMKTLRRQIDMSLGNRPDLDVERIFKQDAEDQAMEDILNDPMNQHADINWKPLTNFAVGLSRHLLAKQENDVKSYDKRFREMAEKIGLNLTPYPSDFNNLVRRIYDGHLSNQLTLAARAATKEQQLSLLAPILNEWKAVISTNASTLAMPLGVESPKMRRQRKNYLNEFAEKLSLFRIQRLQEKDGMMTQAYEYGENAIALGAITKDAALPFSDTYAKLSKMETVDPSITDEASMKIAQDATAAIAKVPHASTEAKVFKDHYTVLDLLEGRVKLNVAGAKDLGLDNGSAPAITDIDFRAQYLETIANDVEQFNAKYYTKVEANTFDELLSKVDGGANMSETAKKLLQAKTQVNAGKFILFKRNGTAYEDGDVDANGNERRIKSLGANIADVDSPLTPELLESIQRHHRVMLRETGANQVAIDVQEYIKQLQANGGDEDAALRVVEEQKGSGALPSSIDSQLNKQLKRYLDAYAAADADLQKQTKHALLVDSGLINDPSGAQEFENGAWKENRRQMAVDAAISRTYTTNILGGASNLYTDEQIEEYAKSLDVGNPDFSVMDVTTHPNFHPQLHNAFMMKAKSDMMKKMEIAAEEGNWEGKEEKLMAKNQINPEYGLPDPEKQGYKHPFRTPDNVYQRTMDLQLDGDDMDRLRAQLSKDIWDPAHHENVDDRIEWFNQPDLHTPFDSRVILQALNEWVGNDPFMAYFDTIPEGVKQAEVLRSSFSLIPPRIVDDAIRSRADDEMARVGRRRNALRYNPSFSYRQLKRYRAGLEKYSGIPPYLLDFAEVAFNPHGKFWVHASKEENHIREMMTEERLRQPSIDLVADRPENSDADVPDISTPITIGGVPANRQAQHVQSHYAGVKKSPRYQRIEQFKVDLNTKLRPHQEGLTATDIDTDELAIAQDMFERARDRILDRNGTIFATSDYDVHQLRVEYEPEISRYREINKKSESLKAAKERGGKLHYDFNGEIVDMFEEEKLEENNMVVPFDSDIEDLYTKEILVPMMNGSNAQKAMLKKQAEEDRKPLERDPADTDEQHAEKEKAFAAAKRKARWERNAKKTEFLTYKGLRLSMNNGHEFQQWLESHDAKIVHQRLGDEVKLAAKDIVNARTKVLKGVAKLFPALDTNTVGQTDPAGLDLVDRIDAIAADEVKFRAALDNGWCFEDGIPIIPRIHGRQNQAMAIMIESFIRFKAKNPSEEYTPHPYETGVMYKRLYGKEYYEPEELAKHKADYLEYVKALDLTVIPEAQQELIDEVMEQSADLGDYVADENGEAPIASQQTKEDAEAYTKEQARKINEKAKAVGRNPDGSIVQAESSTAFKQSRYPSKELVQKRLDHAAKIESEASWEEKSRFYLDSIDQISDRKVDIEWQPRFDGSLGLGDIYEQLDKKQKVDFLLELLDERANREMIAQRREDIMSTVYGTQRQLLRRLTDELQIVKRSERTAFKRIFSLDPQYARQLVGRHLLYATGRRETSDDQNRPGTVHWKVELNYIEELMYSAANRLNARTGGMFPGTPNADNGADPTVFTPPPVISGEFAPMFIDQNMISSGDEFVSPLTRLDFYGNTEFTPSAVLEHATASQRRVGSRDRDLLDNDMKSGVLNTRPQLGEDMLHEANDQIKNEFSEYEFTSEMEDDRIQTSLAQLHLDASTNMAFASAIAKRTKQLQSERAHLESKYKLLYADYDPRIDYRVQNLFENYTGDIIQDDGAVSSRYDDVRYRLKKLMRSKVDLAVDQTDNEYENLHVTDGEQNEDAQQSLMNALNTLTQRIKSTPGFSPARQLEASIDAQLDEVAKKMKFRSTTQLKHATSFAEDSAQIVDQMKAATTKAVKAAVDQANEMKSPATSDILGDAVDFTPTPIRFKGVQVPEGYTDIVKDIQDGERSHVHNTIMQYNAAVLRASRAVPGNIGLATIGTDLLSGNQIDDIVARVTGAVPGGVTMFPTTNEYINKYVRSAEQIMGEILESRLPSGSKHPLNKRTYGLNRSQEDIAADLAKIEAGEQSEYTDVEVLTDFDARKQDITNKFSGYLSALHKMQQRRALLPIRELTIGADSDNELNASVAAPDESMHALMKKQLENPLQLDPSKMAQKQLSTEAFEKKNITALSTQELYIKDVFDGINQAIAQQTRLSNPCIVIEAPGAFEYLPMGDVNSEYGHPRDLELPDGLLAEDVEAIKSLDSLHVYRPKYQFMSPAVRQRMKKMLPSWMRHTRDERDFVKVYDDDQGNRHVVLNKESPILDSDSEAQYSFKLAQGEGPIDELVAEKPATTVIPTRRQRVITAPEAVAMGLSPLKHKQEFTQMQEETIKQTIDEFFAANNMDDALHPAYTENAYLRSLMIFTGLRRFEQSEAIGPEMYANMVYGADIENEDILHPHLNIRNFYQLVRKVEKDDKIERMELEDAYDAAESNLSGLGHDTVKNAKDLVKYNPMNELNARKHTQPALSFLRDLCIHAEAYAAVKEGQQVPQNTTKQWSPLATTKESDKHKRVQHEYSANETDFEQNVVLDNTNKANKVITVDGPDAEHNIMHKALLTTKKTMNGLTLEEIEKIFKVADQQPLPIKNAMYQLLRSHLSNFPESVIMPKLHIEESSEQNPLARAQSQTAHALRNDQIMKASNAQFDVTNDPFAIRNVFVLEEMDLNLVNMSQTFNIKHNTELPAEDMQLFNKIILDCAQEGRVLYPKASLNEIKLSNDPADTEMYTVGFDTDKLAIGKLNQFKPEDLRFSSDSVSVETFNKIMALPKEKLMTFMRYMDYISYQANQVAEGNFYKQLKDDIRSVRPLPDYQPDNVGAAQIVRDIYKGKTQYDKFAVSPGGYMRVGHSAYQDDNAIMKVVQHSKFGRVQGLTTFRPFEEGAPTDDPAYNLKNLDPLDGYYNEDDKLVLDKIYKDMRRNRESLMSDLPNSSDQGFDQLIEDVKEQDRPEDLDLTRRFANLTEYFSDPLNPRQIKLMKQIYEERKLQAFWRGQMSPWDSADVYNNLRMADKMLHHDTFADHDKELARLHREIVVGVVREIMEDQDIELNSLELDSYNIEPEFIPNYAHYDHVNVFAARRFSPYTSLPLSESNIPPIIGIEQQRNIYNLHLLDPVTFHPRWLARRLNVSYSQIIAMLKTYDFRHRANMVTALFDKDRSAQYHVDIDEVDDAPINPEFAKVDIPLPNPPEIQLDQLDEEYLYSRFAPNLIGRVSWTKRPERERGKGDIAWRPNMYNPILFGGDDLARWADQMESTLNKRFVEESQMLDAIEQAAFSRFGPITYATTTPGDLHKPPKLPREIISSSLHPPTRHNWALTVLDESKKSTFGIMIRDRDGYLRHPTYREFKNIRIREKDRRTPFFLRRHHVLGKLPEISSMFIQQVTQIKEDYDSKTNLAREMRSTMDVNFVRQFDYEVLQKREPVNAAEENRENFLDGHRGFDKLWEKLNTAPATQHGLDQSSIRARDWINDYTDNEMKAFNPGGTLASDSDFDPYAQTPREYKSKLLKRNMVESSDLDIEESEDTDFDKMSVDFALPDDIFTQVTDANGKVKLQFSQAQQQHMLKNLNKAIINKSLEIDLSELPTVVTGSDATSAFSRGTTDGVHHLLKLQQQYEERLTKGQKLQQAQSADGSVDKKQFYQRAGMSPVASLLLAKYTPAQVLKLLTTSLNDSLADEDVTKVEPVDLDLKESNSALLTNLPQDLLEQLEVPAKEAMIEKFGQFTDAKSAALNEDILSNVHRPKSQESLDERLLMITQKVKEFKATRDRKNTLLTGLGLKADKEMYHYQRILNRHSQYEEGKLSTDDELELKTMSKRVNKMLLNNANFNLNRPGQPRADIKSKKSLSNTLDQDMPEQMFDLVMLQRMEEQMQRAEEQAKLRGRVFNKQRFIENYLMNTKRDNPSRALLPKNKEERDAFLAEKRKNQYHQNHYLPKPIQDKIDSLNPSNGSKYKQFLDEVNAELNVPYFEKVTGVPIDDLASQDMRRYLTPEEIAHEEKVASRGKDQLDGSYVLSKINFIHSKAGPLLIHPNQETEDFFDFSNITDPQELGYEVPIDASNPVLEKNKELNFLMKHGSDPISLENMRRYVGNSKKYDKVLDSPDQVDFAKTYLTFRHPNIAYDAQKAGNVGQYSGDEGGQNFLNDEALTDAYYKSVYGKVRGQMSKKEYAQITNFRNEMADIRKEHLSNVSATAGEMENAKREATVYTQETLDALFHNPQLEHGTFVVQPDKLANSVYNHLADTSPESIAKYDEQYKTLTKSVKNKKVLEDITPNSFGYSKFKNLSDKFDKHHGL